MGEKLAELTDLIYREGVQKGEEEANELIKSSKQKGEAIIEEAKKKAEEIIANAKIEAEESKRNAMSEIKLSGRQAVNAVKQQIVDLITSELLDDSVSKALDDPDTIKDLISTVVSNWDIKSGESLSINVLLAENKRDELEKMLASSLKNLLKKGLTLKFSKKVKGGFQIGPQDGSFKISMTDEDFNEFFKEYLRPKTRSILFEEK